MTTTPTPTDLPEAIEPSGEWKVGLFRSSADSRKAVRMVAQGSEQIAEFGAHRDFIRWDAAAISAAAPAVSPQAVADSYMPSAAPQVVATAPQRIYLDLGFDPSVEDAPFSTLHEVTWSADNASGHGIEYVRAYATAALRARGAVPSCLQLQHDRDSQEMRSLCESRDKARRERDACKAEIAGLEASCATLGRLVDEVRADGERLEWVLRRCRGSWLRAYLGVANDTGDMAELRVLIDANRGAAPQPPAALPGEQDADLWYLQDTRSYVGNDVLWWAKDARGYTTDISKAHVYTREQAFQHAAMRDYDRPWPKAYIDGKTRPAVDLQYIDHVAAMATAKGRADGGEPA